MKYRVFFLMLTAYLGWLIVFLDDPWRLILLWPLISCLIMAVAYWLNSPKFVMGKRANGKLNWILVVLNLPWLIITWSMWLLQAVLSKENVIDKIPGIEVYISRYPLWGVDLNRFKVVIDLTAEFPKIQGYTGYYIAMPSLDGMPLSNIELPLAISNEGVLIHCAQGHGRSATYASILLGGLPYFDGADKAYAAILSVRPKATVGKEQLLQVRNVANESVT